MRSKLTLSLSISAGVLTLILMALLIASQITSTGKTSIQHANNEYIDSIITELGDIKLETSLSEEYLKKDSFIIKNTYGIQDYKQLFEQYFKENKIQYRHKVQDLNSIEILSLFFEDESGFLRIIELKKIKKGILVKKSSEGVKPKPIIIKKEPNPDIKNTEYSDHHPSVISIVIDDCGITDHLQDEFLNYPFPLTYAVIPLELYSLNFSKEANSMGKELIIHAPMEGSDHIHHYSTLKSDYTEEKIRELLLSYKKEVPGAIGLNNHRGSKATENKEFLNRFFRQFKSLPLFFLDSKTSPNSMAYTMAVNRNIPSVERDIFLDHHDNEQYITKQVFELIKLGRTKKGAIGIGHMTKPNTLKVLKKFIPYFKEHNVKLIPLSEVVKRKYYVSLRN